jgi:hypothetical protein
VQGAPPDPIRAAVFRCQSRKCPVQIAPLMHPWQSNRHRAGCLHCPATVLISQRASGVTDGVAFIAGIVAAESDKSSVVVALSSWMVVIVALPIAWD